MPADSFLAGGDDFFSALVAVVLVVILLPVIIVFAVMLAELLLLLLLLPVWIVVRAVLGGKWPLEVWHGKNLVGTESVKGWGASGVRMHDIAEGIRLRRPGAPYDFGESASS